MNFEFNKVAVIGAGTMGSGIALVLAKAGIEVNLNDVKEEYLAKGMEQINKFLKGSVKRGKMTEEEANQIKNRISISINLIESTKNAQMVIEAIFEEFKAKEKCLQSLMKSVKKK